MRNKNIKCYSRTLPKKLEIRPERFILEPITKIKYDKITKLTYLTKKVGISSSREITTAVH